MLEDELIHVFGAPNSADSLSSLPSTSSWVPRSDLVRGGGESLMSARGAGAGWWETGCSTQTRKGHTAPPAGNSSVGGHAPGQCDASSWSWEAEAGLLPAGWLGQTPGASQNPWGSRSVLGVSWTGRLLSEGWAGVGNGDSGAARDLQQWELPLPAGSRRGDAHLSPLTCWAPWGLHCSGWAQHCRLNRYESEQTPGGSGKQRSLVCCNPMGLPRLSTQLSD